MIDSNGHYGCEGCGTRISDWSICEGSPTTPHCSYGLCSGCARRGGDCTKTRQMWVILHSEYEAILYCQECRDDIVKRSPELVDRLNRFSSFSTLRRT